MPKAASSEATTGSIDCLLGIDTGGTFTDFVLFDGDGLRVFKCLSTPEAPEAAIIQGVKTLSADKVPTDGWKVTHGSTVATNAVLEGKGVPTAYIGNKGLADVLTIGRQARRELYNLQPEPVEPPVPAAFCLEVPQRTSADGSEVQSLTDEALDRVVAELREIRPQACAVNLLFSFLDPGPEQKIGERIMAEFPEMFVSCSSEVLPEYREYERGMATWLNASVGPLIGRYLQRLQARLPVKSIAIMHSAAGTISIDHASSRAVNLLLSGPAGGLLAAKYIGGLLDEPRMLTFDMGGTSTDVALIDGEIRLTSEGKIANWPVAVPMVDMHTIGAGGGSLARLDAGGLLQVGPESAGASPGPVCYGQGGVVPTVTDANLVLGRLPANTCLGGDLKPDLEAARIAFKPLAKAMGTEIEDAARGVIQVANEHMAQALRVISVEKGEDPADFALMSFGGAGGLHVCALAEAMGMSRAVVPVYAGVLSALGMLVARSSRQLSQSVLEPINDTDEQSIDAALAALQEKGVEELVGEGVEPSSVTSMPSLDLRYVGQSHALNLPWRGKGHAAEDFHQAHESRYGHRLDLPVELVNIRMAVQGPESALQLPLLEPSSGMPETMEGSMAHGIAGEVPHYRRETLLAGDEIEGPAIILETVSTTFIDPGWRARVDRYGNLLLRKIAG